MNEYKKKCHLKGKTSNEGRNEAKTNKIKYEEKEI